MTFDYDEINPTGGSFIANFPGNEVSHRGAVLGSVNVDHYAEDGPAGSQDGQHRQVSLPPLDDDPLTGTTEGFLYTKDVDAITELFYMDHTGQVVQLTSDSSASPDKLPLAGGTLTGKLLMDTVELEIDGAPLRMTNGDILVEGTSILKLQNAVYQQGRNDADTLWADLLGRDASDVTVVGNGGFDTRIRADDVDGVVAEYGDSDKKIWHAGHFANAPLLTKSWTSTPITPLVLGTQGSIPHGLGTTPEAWSAFFTCVTDEEGYVTGDTLPNSSYAEVGTNAYGLGVSLNAAGTEFDWRVGSKMARAFNTTTGQGVTLDEAKWSFSITAWYFE